MSGSEQRVTDEAQLLQRYLDGELSSREAAAFRERLAASPELRRELAELRQVGSALRDWAAQQGQRAAPLLEVTLRRAGQSEAKPRRHLALAVAMVSGLALLPSAHEPFPSRIPVAVALSEQPAPAAAIERLVAVDERAQVFLVRGSSTPVVWLNDSEGEASGQDPG